MPRAMYEVKGQVFSLTICTAGRRRLFQNPALAAIVMESLTSGEVQKRLDLFACCLMPDHLHLLAAPRFGNLIDTIGRWKRFTGYLLSKAGIATPLWQRGFYDHALRDDEDLVRAAEYMVMNPVRAGLVTFWDEYPFSWHRWMEDAGGRYGDRPYGLATTLRCNR